MVTRIGVLAGLLAVALGGCGPGRYYTSKVVVGPDGTRNHVVIECRLRVDCLVLAGKACRHGYVFENDDGRATHSTIMVGCRKLHP